MKCINCNKDTTNPKFCTKKCAAVVNNKLFVKRRAKKKKTCVNCKTIIRHDRKFCSNKCQVGKNYTDYIQAWKSGKLSGLTMNGTVKPQVKKYLMLKYNNACSICGWSKMNSHTGKIPLVADHIDGNFENNTENNLRIVCWNCDSLSPTFGGSNRGNGRAHRKNLNWKDI